MEALILNKSFASVAMIEMFESLIWTDRYNAWGDFEIYTSITGDIRQNAKQDYYIWIPKSEHIMIIEEHLITSDIENGNRFTIRGRSLESILDRRIIWRQTVLTGNFQEAIRRLLIENVTNAYPATRKIGNFIFEYSTDPRITSLSIDAQFTGTNLYEAIERLCKERKLGFKIILNDNNQMVFSLYMGQDRSYSQTANPYVIFSSEFENLLNSNYLESNKLLKNAALVAGEGEGTERKTLTINGRESGLERREEFVDARDISSDTPDGILTDEEYNAQLLQRGNQKLAEYKAVKTFEGDIETTQAFIYGRDFFLGDTVQITNEFNIEASANIVEIIFSINNEGENIVPTFNVAL